MVLWVKSREEISTVSLEPLKWEIPSEDSSGANISGIPRELEMQTLKAPPSRTLTQYLHLNTQGGCAP